MCRATSGTLWLGVLSTRRHLVAPGSYSSISDSLTAELHGHLPGCVVYRSALLAFRGVADLGGTGRHSISNMEVRGRQSGEGSLRAMPRLTRLSRLCRSSGACAVVQFIDAHRPIQFILRLEFAKLVPCSGRPVQQ